MGVEKTGGNCPGGAATIREGNKLGDGKLKKQSSLLQKYEAKGEVLVVHLMCEQIYPQENFSMSI